MYLDHEADFWFFRGFGNVDAAASAQGSTHSRCKSPAMLMIPARQWG